MSGSLGQNLETFQRRLCVGFLECDLLSLDGCRGNLRSLPCFSPLSPNNRRQMTDDPNGRSLMP
ncbi:MAG: hypothetical protein ICV85_02815 [Tolypothrix sp. T3-bin4]|nr:hypothetical protein [Tolypothrix sp. T3-bin4]